jgi:uncharacterized protein YdiU (UPF0061 family)
MLQVPLQMLINPTDLEVGLAQFDEHYHITYCQRMLAKLGFGQLPIELSESLLQHTLQFLKETLVNYHDFFLTLRQQFSVTWRQDETKILATLSPPSDSEATCLAQWRQVYHRALQTLPEDEMGQIGDRLCRYNPNFALLRPEIEAIWESIVIEDNWQPFYDLLKRIKIAVVQEYAA